ncbi:hypothetical protein RND71_039737 [Anisodus tanguticus]|uniref:Uncharacterized protein n=1 Tax=Anisodus tanguticus TaxID=243964 RepID=A0AAE1QXQ9_9SOLA|nr:hypothetical protein RND71_039737 [Anisodus tanguticus]
MSQAKCASAIGILAGVGSAAFVATIASMVAAVYMQIFLEDTACFKYSIEQPILGTEMENIELDCETSKNIKVKVPSLRDIVCFLKKSATFSLAASVAFLNSLAEGGERAPFQLLSIVSKQNGPIEQGIAQGCISSISSIANILSPFIYSPLTALFLSEKAPFPYPGFSILCIGLAWVSRSMAQANVETID